MLNETGQQLNFDTSNIRVEGPVAGIRVLTKDEMVKAAKKRATKAMIFAALAGVAAAYSASTATDHYKVRSYTAFGNYTTIGSGPSANGDLLVGAAGAATGASMAAIRKRLDETRAGLKSAMVQMTTVDPGASYGGLIFLSKFKTKAPADLKLWVKIGT